MSGCLRMRRLGATNVAAERAEKVIREEADRFGKEHHKKDVLKSLTTFVGGGGPRFWFSVEPEQQQLNYAQIIVEVTDKHLTNEFVGPLADGVEPRCAWGPHRRAATRNRQAGRHTHFDSDFGTG